MEVLVVDDQRSAQRVLTALLEDIPNVHVHVAASREAALVLLDSQRIDVAFIDLRLAPNGNARDGLLLVEHMSQASLGVPIVVSGITDIHDVREAMRLGAHDYILKDELCFELLQPIIVRLQDRARMESELRSLRARTRPTPTGPALVGASTAMRRLRGQLDRVVLSNRPVLVQGPTGSGKEVVVQYLHSRGPNPDGPLLDVNCGALPENLIESQLFGHEKGAFTGAVGRQDGYFRTVGKGTLFLDEMGDMPLALQSKLLRVLESGKFRPLGSAKEQTFEGRLVAATHVDLAEAVRRRAFREDLFYRLNVLTIAVPSLDERRDDIPALVAHFVRQQPRSLAFDEDAIIELQRRPWPGNVRELRNAIDRIGVFADSDQISRNTIVEILDGPSAIPRVDDIAGQILQLGVDDKLTFIRQTLITSALARADGSKTEAARLLGVHRKVIERAMKDRPDDGETD
jgi:DNA-binding NtrC family response regulator